MTQRRKLSVLRVFSLIIPLVLGGLVLFLQSELFAQGTAARKAGKASPKEAASTASAETQRFKGIWEPVNYSQDVEFTDVLFVAPDVGWAIGYARSEAGEGGFILNTRDGGQTWNVQLGDPHSPTRGFEQLQFIDETHGWATQWSGNMLRTTDGETWEVIGAYPSPRVPYRFTSPTTGVYINGQTISRTEDGGRTWKEVFTCRTKVEVEGLVREVGCSLTAVHFPSPSLGYAVSQELPNKSSALLRSEDGGASWNISSFLPEADAKTVFFVDENTGFVKSYDKLFTTSDGGRTWRSVPVPVPVGASTRFADPEVGWICLGNQNSSMLTYTTDGGKRWSAREFRLPTGVNAFSLPQRDRGYVVGSHGMVYRYRVVPVTEVVAKAIDAPAMPGIDMQLNEQVVQVEKQVDALKEEIKLKLEDQVAPGAALVGARAETEKKEEKGTTEKETGKQEASVGDTGTGGIVDACCSEKVGQLETAVQALVGEIPKVTGKYRNLNLVLVGIRVIGQLFGQSQGLKDSLSALRKARDYKSASTLLTQFSNYVDVVANTTKTAFANTTPQKPQ